MQKQRMGTIMEFEFGEMSFIESRLDIGQEQAVPLIGQTNEYVDQKFDEEYIKVFDAPPGTSCPVIEATKDVDYVILVTEPTPFGLHDLKLAVETMKELKKDFGVVINRYGLGNDDVIDYCNKENVKLLAKIPNSRKVAETYSKGQLIYEIPEIKEQFLELKSFILNYKKELVK
jgi:MinD superfamily P-loop ATPase